VDSANLIQTVLNGRTGPITVNGTQYGGNMPSWRGQLSDAQIAAVLTYVRTAWQNGAPAVSEDQVAAARAPEALSVPSSLPLSARPAINPLVKERTCIRR